MIHGYAKDALLAAAGFGLFAAGDAAGKTLTGAMTPFEISFWYGFFSLVCLLLAAPRLGGLRATVRSRKLKWHALRAVLTGIMPPLIFFALQTMPLVNFYTLVFTAPFLSALIAVPFLKEKIPPARWLIILGGFAGVVVSMRPDVHGIGLTEIAVLLTALSFALRNLIVQRMGSQETILSYGLYPYLGIVAVSAPFVFADFNWPGLHEFSLTAFIGASSAIGLIALSIAFRDNPSSVIAPLHYTQLIWGLLFGVAVFGQGPDLWTLTGAAIVTACGVALIIVERRQGKTTPPDARVLPP